MARVLLIGTIETKREELAYFQAALRRYGLDVRLLDVSLGSQGAIWSGAEKLARMAAKAQAAAADVGALCEDCQVAVGVGGGTGGEIVLAAMKGLPATYPKILITTLAFDPRPALADSAITIIPTLCDIEGLNRQLRQVFENAAAAVSGLTKARPIEQKDRKTVAVTTLGATGPAGTAIARGLAEQGIEPTVFHANGYGGAAFTRFVEDGNAQGVIDLNVHELGRIRIAGAHVPMPARFSCAIGLPRVVLPGALELHRARRHRDGIARPPRARALLPYTAVYPCRSNPCGNGGSGECARGGSEPEHGAVPRSSADGRFQS